MNSVMAVPAGAMTSRMSVAPALHCAAVLFDLDGVLVDSAECVERTWRRWATRHNLDAARVIELAHGRRTIETVRLVAPHLAAANEVAVLASGEASTTEGVYKVPGARELLESLPPNAWAIVTSGVRAVATVRLHHTALPMPRVLVCADDIQRGKPDPEGYLVAAHQLGRVPADCVVVEDTPAGLQAARAAGMRVIAVSGTFPAEALATANVVLSRLSMLRITKTANGLALQ
jgi:mannitol-1-/sugar-/sorbitol-6-phosphatase